MSQSGGCKNHRTSVEKTWSHEDEKKNWKQAKRGRTAAKDADTKRGGGGGAQWPAPAPAADIKLPEKYRLLPVPKGDGAHAQDEHVVQLSRAAKAPQISLREDLRTAVGYKGYDDGTRLGPRARRAAAHLQLSPPAPPATGTGWCARRTACTRARGTLR